MPKNLGIDKVWDLCGSHCTWCGKFQENAGYLLAILLVRHGSGIKQLNHVCCECIASDNIPKDVNRADLPWYDPQERRIYNEKLHSGPFITRST